MRPQILAGGPPPFSLEDLLAMTDRESKLRAIHALKSYITGIQSQNSDSYVDSNHVAHEPTIITRLNFNRTLDNVNQDTLGNHGSRSRSLYGPIRSGAFRDRGHGLSPYPQPRQAPRRARRSTTIFSSSSPPFEVSVASSSSDMYEMDTNNYDLQAHEQQEFCPLFTSRGVCYRAGCWKKHDPGHLAVCTHWLYKDGCTYGADVCRLLHETNSHNAPTCLHHVLGKCTNHGCQFAHARIDPTARLCVAFGRLGYCEKGDQCKSLHLHECPDFFNLGSCRAGSDCRLRHVKDSSRIRSALLRASAIGQAGAVDNADDVCDQGAHHDFTQQASFIPLDD